MKRVFLAIVLLVVAGGGVWWWWSARLPPPVAWQGYAEADFVKIGPTQQGLLTAVAVAALLGSGVLTAAQGGTWMIPAGVGFAAGLLLLWALCGRASPLLGLVEIAARAGTRIVRRPVGGTWRATVAECRSAVSPSARWKRASPR